jgi:hypothetical protein
MAGYTREQSSLIDVRCFPVSGISIDDHILLLDLTLFSSFDKSLLLSASASRCL